MTTPESELHDHVKLAIAGDPASLSSIIRLTQARLFRFCILLTHDRQLAQDLTQDTFVRALSEIRKLKDPATFQGWLLKIAKNLFLDHLKSPRNARTDHLEEEEAHSGKGTDAVAPDTALSLHLLQVLAQLKPDDRLLLLLIDLEGYSYKEAAEIIGQSESNVRFRLHHIRKEFTEKYAK